VTGADQPVPRRKRGLIVPLQRCLKSWSHFPYSGDVSTLAIRPPDWPTYRDPGERSAPRVAAEVCTSLGMIPSHRFRAPGREVPCAAHLSTKLHAFAAPRTVQRVVPIYSNFVRGIKLGMLGSRDPFGAGSDPQVPTGIAP
jgi:hypothetical protein